MSEPTLSAAQQDYLEAVYVLVQSSADGVRITDIAAELGTKLPTVVRGVARLRDLKLLSQQERGLVRLTVRGEELAAQLLHRHTDIVTFLTRVLGTSAERAEAEACLIEHGLSGETAERLHRFLERWESLSAGQRAGLAGTRRRLSVSQFTLLGEAGGAGGRK